MEPKSMPNSIDEKARADSMALRKFREYFTAVIALIVLAGAFIVIWLATARSQTFDQIKDLLLFINPLVGIVIGYYFNKASTEARAENAENTAESAVATAQKATQERDHATSEVKEVRSVLTEVTDAAQAMVDEVVAAPPAAGFTPGVLGIGGEEDRGGAHPPASRSMIDLQNALARAQKVKKQ